MGKAAKYATSLRRILGAPFALLYGAALRLRHALYDAGVLRAVEPPRPTVVVGNVALGGTGKTPHVELVLRNLRDLGPLATLSRGYGRSGTAVLEVRGDEAADAVGDEPLQLKRHFPGVRVFVGADRVEALAHIAATAPEVKAVVLDDALQHRPVKARLNLVLTTWTRPWCDDALLPAGTLRDLPARARQAEAVIVTKCPHAPTVAEQAAWRKRLALRSEQALFFSGLRYAPLRWLDGRLEPVPEGPDVDALLVTGIADPAPLVAEVRRRWGRVEHAAFPDHHRFTPADLARLAGLFGTFARRRNVLITTEKDAMRLRSVITGSPIEKVPVAVIGVEAVILTDTERFSTLLHHHVGTHPAHR
ncbi:MAG: tetraacyldisaccharide 4'-kinase [Flavobacteriales bacterium]|nr:tetraacyldisaccharide 4'-kinase [Flavobacteriales bacterium]